MSENWFGIGIAAIIIGLILFFIISGIFPAYSTVIAIIGLLLAGVGGLLLIYKFSGG